MSIDDTPSVLPPPLPLPDHLDNLNLSRVGGDPGPKATAHGFVHPQAIEASESRRSVYGAGRSEEDEEDDEMDGYEDEDAGDDVDLINNDIGAVRNEKFKSFSSPYVGSDRGVMLKEGGTLKVGHDNGNASITQNDNNQNQQERVGKYQNAVTIAEPSENMFNPQYMHGAEEGSGIRQKDMLIDNGCGSSGRKGDFYVGEPGNPLRAILSDPVTGALMEDAMILPCGHSFGSGGIQHVLRMKACFTCSQPVSEESVSQNLSLRAAVQAFRREEQLRVPRSTKRRREISEQERGSYSNSMTMDHPRSRDLQFPFAVTDRVVILGNKRTPPRFIGREAIVTTQCLNGWYVVKTLDNAESVKLQYRSLAKVPDHTPPRQTRCLQDGIRVSHGFKF